MDGIDCKKKYTANLTILNDESFAANLPDKKGGRGPGKQVGGTISAIAETVCAKILSGVAVMPEVR